MLTQASAFKIDHHGQAKLSVSRRGLATAICGGAFIAMLSGCETMVRTPVNAQLERLNRVGQLISQRGLSLHRAMRFGISQGQSFKAVSSTNSTILVPQSAIDLCENDGQLAGILAYLLQGLPIQPANTLVAKSPMESRESTAGNGIIRALARVGYDPRDGLAIWQKVRLNGQVGTLPIDTLMLAMASELGAMGYVV